MGFRVYLTVLVIVVLPGLAVSDPEVGISELPDWVEELQIEEFSSDRTGEFQLGVAYLLSDRQVRKTSDGYDYFERLAYRVTDRSGLEDSATIAQAFDPENGTLSFNFVRVLRNGDVIDKLTDADITVLRQEEGLDSSLIDGHLTALIQLEDIRVGDVIDYSYSGSVVSKLWPSEHFEAISVEWSIPLAQMHFNLTVPQEMNVATRSISTDIDPLVTVDNGWRSFKLHVRDSDPIPMEQNVPNDWAAYGFVAFTTMDSWTDVVDWAVPLFSFDDPLPAEFVQKLDNIASAHSRPEVRAIHALRLVQADIRYLGLEIGLGSHIPRSPSVTLERGYGDCKDKSVLLVSALKYLGIDAVPALASTSGGEILPQIPPSMDGFNHVIVGLRIDGKQLWVDPTLSYQGGLAETLAPLGYGYVLPISPDQSELVELDKPLPDAPTLEIAETFEFSEIDDVALRVTVEHIYRRSLADFSRFQVASLGPEGLARGFLDYYAANYEGLTESRPVTVTDDMDANVVIYRAEYEMDSHAFDQSDYGDNLPIFATAVQGILPQQVEASRVAPLGLPYGASTQHTIRIVTPGRRLSLPRSKTKSVAGISYARKFKNDGEAFEIEYDLNVTEEAADLGSIRTVTNLADEIMEDSRLTIYLSKAVPTLTRQLELETPLDLETENAITLVGTQIARKDYVKALTGLNTLLDIHDEATKLSGYLQLQKADVLVLLGRAKAAIEPFEKGFEIYEPKTTGSYFAYLGILAREGEDERAVKMTIRMLENHPEAVSQMNMDWFGRFSAHLKQSDMSTERDSLVLAIARAAHKSKAKDIDDYRWVFADAVGIESRSGNAENASQYLQYLRDPEVFVGLLTSRDTEAIWAAIEQEAGADLSKAISGFVSSTKDETIEDPDDFKTLRRHLAALRIAQQFDEAIDFAEPIVDDWPRIEAVGDDAYWFVNEYAYTLSDAGHPGKVHSLMSRLMELGVLENSELISMAINRSILLLNWGDFEAALAAVMEIESLDDDIASDYGWMWIYHAKACSLYQLERTQEADTVLRDSIGPIADKNPSAHTKTLLCFDDLDKAADIVMSRLHDKEELDGVISSFVETIDQNSLPPFLAELQSRAEAVRARSEVRKEFDKVGRVISVNGAGASWVSF